MLNDKDLERFDKHQISIDPPSPKLQKCRLENLANNPFLYLENNHRFLSASFVKFPDEQRRLYYQGKAFLLFGKSEYHQCYFMTGDDGRVYQMSFDVQDFHDDGTFDIIPVVLHLINQNVASFTICSYYFLTAIYKLIGEHQLMGYQAYFNPSDNTNHENGEYDLYQQISDEYQQKVQDFDTYAMTDTEGQVSYWWTLYHMLIEADLAFYLPVVGLGDYIDTGRFG